MESSLLLIEQQERMQEVPLLIEPALEQVAFTEQTKKSTTEQPSAKNDIGIRAVPARVSGYSPCERLFKALIPFKYMSETKKKEIVVWASDRQDADELYASMMGSTLCNST